jgi:hypothetical protein
LVLEVVNHRINSTHPHRNIHPYHLDFRQQDCDGRCLRKTVEAAPKETYPILIVENIKNAGQLSEL